MNILFITFVKTIPTVLVSLTACLDIMLWLLAFDELQKVVLFLTNVSYN